MRHSNIHSLVSSNYHCYKRDAVSGSHFTYSKITYMYIVNIFGREKSMMLDYFWESFLPHSMNLHLLYPSLFDKIICLFQSKLACSKKGLHGGYLMGGRGGERREGKRFQWPRIAAYSTFTFTLSNELPRPSTEHLIMTMYMQILSFLLRKYS